MKNNEENIILTVDCVVVVDRKVLLIKRNIEPFLGRWVLPGGHVEYGETVEKAAKRELKEETGLESKNLELVGVYSDPGRDPRGHTVSCAFLIKVEDDNEIQLNREASDFAFFTFDDLPTDLGFDHIKILEDAQKEI